MDYNNLKDKYNTPLYIYDVDLMKKIINQYKENFKSRLFETEIIYASKALNIKAMLRLLMRYDLSLDVVSYGELFTAKSVNFPFNKIYFHGNNKSFAELKFAIENNIGIIVVDNLEELFKIEFIAEELQKNVNVYIRLNLGIEAHTHKYIVTSHVDSKFGVLYDSFEYNSMVNLIKESNYINLCGFHSHIGSQIFDLNPYNAAVERLVNIVKGFDYPLGINLGGGFGVKYIESDKPVSYDIVSGFLINSVERELIKQNAKITKLSIEPGRSIVAEAGKTLYTIGGIKQTPNKLYYFIDGGMTDNIRPALYEAKYECDIVGKENMLKNKVVSIAGKCCESGDIIIENIPLPEASVGDLLVTYSTGAYGYSMSSNYNKAITPAVVFVEDGRAELVVKRQTYDELLEREI